MQKPMAFGELRPDVSQIDTQFANVADNVFPAIDTYKPFPSLLPLNPTLTALPAACKGLYAARKADGNWKIYAGTATDLYLWTATGFVSATRLAGGSYNVVNGWTFAQFGTNLYACSGVNDVLQSIDIEAGANFAAASGSPPLARTVGSIGDFLVLGGLGTNPRQIQWSSVNNPGAWVVGVNLSDIQEFPEGGPVQGVSGSESVGYIVQDRTIRTAQFLPGDTTFIFSFTRSVKERGSVSPQGFTSVADVLYYPAEDGFYALANSQSIPIGQDKINDFFQTISDVGRKNSILCFQSSKIYILWAFYGSGSSTSYDRLLLYNWANQRFSTASVQAQAFALAASVGLDEETTGSETGDTSADSTAASMDSPLYIGGRPIIMAIDIAGRLCSLTGANLGATLETSEAHLAPGQRAYVSEVRPMIDSANCSVTPGQRERLGDPVVYGSAIPIEVTGAASVLSSSRLFRFRVTTPPGDVWSRAEGVIAEAQPDGYA